MQDCVQHWRHSPPFPSCHGRHLFQVPRLSGSQRQNSPFSHFSPFNRILWMQSQQEEARWRQNLAFCHCFFYKKIIGGIFGGKNPSILPFDSFIRDSLEASQIYPGASASFPLAMSKFLNFAMCVYIYMFIPSLCHSRFALGTLFNLEF